MTNSGRGPGDQASATAAAQDTAALAFERRSPRSRAAHAAARLVLPSGITRQTLFYEPYPFFAREGDGAFITDLDGERYLDLVNNFTSLIHGHAHPPTVAALRASLERGTALGAPTELELELAEVLLSRVASIDLIRFVVSGSEAVGYALRAARAHTGRERILKFEGGFHGCFGEVQLSVGAAPMEPGAFGPGEPMSAGLGDTSTVVAVYNDEESLAAAFDAHGHELAAVILEPFLGNGALIPARPEFMARVADLARAHGALLILDEIQSCRLALGGAQDAYGVTPDLTTLGKTIGGGMPLAAVGGRREVMEAFDGATPRIVQTGTFNGFSTSLVAALATLAHWGDPEIARLNELGASLRAEIAATFARHGVAAAVNGEGSMFNITLGSERVDSYAELAAADSASLDSLHKGLLARGIYLSARGTGTLSTPMGGEETALLIAALEDCIGAGLLA